MSTIFARIDVSLQRSDLSARLSAQGAALSTAGGGGPGGGPPLAAPPAAGPSGLAATTAQIDAVHSLLDAAPDPFDVEGILAWVRDATDPRMRELFPNFPLPILDELIDPLQTL